MNDDSREPAPGEWRAKRGCIFPPRMTNTIIAECTSNEGAEAVVRGLNALERRAARYEAALREMETAAVGKWGSAIDVLQETDDTLIVIQRIARRALEETP